MSKQRKPIPFDFVLEELYSENPNVRPMFGCHAIYVRNKLVLILRKRNDHERDNGVWIATDPGHHESLKRLFPSMRSIELLGRNTTSWQNLPVDADDFEESVIKACSLILKNDARIGKIPKKKKKRSSD